MLLCFAAVGVSMATTDAIASAAVVRCGEPVVADALRKRDLKCSEDGPILTTGGVTLDLNGHTITGSGGRTGILIRPCNETGELVVKDGSVSGFSTGISIAADYGCDHTATTVTRLLITNNQTGVLGGIDGGRHGTTLLRGNTIRANTGNGILATPTPTRTRASATSWRRAASGRPRCVTRAPPGSSHANVQYSSASP